MNLKIKKIELLKCFFYLRKNIKHPLIQTFIFFYCIPFFGLSSKDYIPQNKEIIMKFNVEVSIDKVFSTIKDHINYAFMSHGNVCKYFPDAYLNKRERSKELFINNVISRNANITLLHVKEMPSKENESDFKVQRHNIFGVVTDQSGMPISGVHVVIKGTNRGGITDLDGKFTIKIREPTNNILVFRSLGFKTKEVAVGNQTTFSVSLKEDIGKLEVVTINAGYYSTTERERTGNISKIEAKIIEKQPVNNPLAAMQGHLPGVNITQSTGLPGGNYRIQIRGQNFIDKENQLLGISNNPLYVVNGVPYVSQSLESTDVLGGIINGGVSPLNSINPIDIERIEVLKDADATAIYGSRGANGVVLITTKRGKEGTTQIKANVSTTISRVTGFVDLLNTEQYLEGLQEAIENDGYTIETLPAIYKNGTPELYLWDSNRYTDWQKELIGGAAYRQNGYLSYSKGGRYTQFLLSGGLSRETTVFPGDSKYNRASVMVNINHQSVNERFKLNVSTNYVTDSNNLPTRDFIGYATSLAPNAPALYDSEGRLNWENNTWFNPLGYLETKYNAKADNLIINTVLSYWLMPSLEFKANFGYNNYQLNSYAANPHTRNPPTKNNTSSASLTRTNKGDRQSWILEPQVHWKYDWGDMRLKCLLGASFQQNKEQQLGLFGMGFSSNDLLLDLSQASIQRTDVDRESEYKYQAFFGRINLNWKRKYILNLTGRRDGSSRFGPGKQFGYFGAIGSAWLFSEENILKESAFLNFGKLRASYGITGNDASTDYAFLDAFEEDNSYNYNGSVLRSIRLFNPYFTWEETKKLEVALELGFLNNRIFLNGVWYRNRSSNQLLDQPLPSTTGFTGVHVNLDAIVQNIGFEFDLRAVNIQTNHFMWSTTFNLSTNKNKLVAFPSLETSSFKNQLMIGQPLMLTRRYHFLGVNPETGIAQFEDYNNDGVIDFNDRQRIVDLTPKYFGGLGNTISYKGFQLDVFFQFQKQMGEKYIGHKGLTPGFSRANITSVLDRWQQIGDQKPIQRYSRTNDEVLKAWGDFASSNAVIGDISFIRLRNISLNYTVPKTYTKGMDLNIFLQGQNIFVITPYDGADPEIRTPSILPPLRQLTMGVNISF